MENDSKSLKRQGLILLALIAAIAAFMVIFPAEKRTSWLDKLSRSLQASNPVAGGK